MVVESSLQGRMGELQLRMDAVEVEQNDSYSQKAP